MRRREGWGRHQRTQQLRAGRFMGQHETEITRLSQSDVRKRLLRDLASTELVTVYETSSHNPDDCAIYCALIPTKSIDQSLKDPAWDLLYGEGLPSAAVSYGDGKEQVRYLRFGTGSVEPLVFDRTFHGQRPDYVEVCEEFRHFHELFHDQKTGQLIKIKDGAEELVGVIESDCVKIRLLEIRQFLAIKEMHLALMFDGRASSKISLQDLGLKEGEKSKHRDKDCCWSLGYGDFHGLGGDRAFSRLIGKRLISPLPKEKSGFWGYAKEVPKKYLDFVIGVDDVGDEISFTSDPSKLANNFGANAGAPNYLTPVPFRKSVLEKYYAQSSKFRIDSGRLSCGSLWGLQIDNHHDDKVVVWLGDLGRDLPYEEQHHWRSHNIASVGVVSETYFSRQIMAQFADSNRIEHRFQRIYSRLAETSGEMLGWPLLKDLDGADRHHFTSLRVPANDEQKDFDDLVLSLTKILVDSLNEKELNKIIGASSSEIVGSIARLDKALSTRGVLGYESHIKFLQKLQSLRSTGSAHRKGSNYRKIAGDFGVDSQDLRAVFTGILQKGYDFLEFLLNVVQAKKLS